MPQMLFTYRSTVRHLMLPGVIDYGIVIILVEFESGDYDGDLLPGTIYTAVNYLCRDSGRHIEGVEILQFRGVLADGQNRPVEVHGAIFRECPLNSQGVFLSLVGTYTSRGVNLVAGGIHE